MTLEEKYELSKYQDLIQIDDDKEVWLVWHKEQGGLYIKKKLAWYNQGVYERLWRGEWRDVPKIYLCVKEAGELIVIEEYIHGTSLGKRLEQQGCLSEEEVAEIMIEVCRILQQFHGADPAMIHRDIKPSNIMISQDGKVKLIDFNAARENLGEKEEDTRLMGTRKFAAPEQYGFGQSDARADIYGMGITMKYLLTGNLDSKEKYSGWLSPIMQKCTALDKEKRYPSVMELQKDLRKGCEEKTDTTPEPLYPPNENLPVGFRSGSLGKMALATFGYVLGGCACLFMTIDDKTHVIVGVELWMYRIAALICFLGAVIFLGNYKNVRYKLPFMKGKKWLHVILTPVYLFLYFCLIVLLLAILLTIG